MASSQFLMRIRNGFLHTHKNICLRVSTNNLDRVYKVADKWLTIPEPRQDYISELDKTWQENEKELLQRKTELELYSFFHKLPSKMKAYKDFCGNNVAHRIILALVDAPPKMVADFWYLIENDIEHYMYEVNTFGHTPWEVMTAAGKAFEQVLLERPNLLHKVIPIRSWRSNQVFKAAWDTMTLQQKGDFIATNSTVNIEFVCYMVDGNVDDFIYIVNQNKFLLNSAGSNILDKYPLLVEPLAAIALAENREDVIMNIIATKTF